MTETIRCAGPLSCEAPDMRPNRIIVIGVSTTISRIVSTIDAKTRDQNPT